MTTTFGTFVREPFDLAIGQPHQLLISSASVAIVALEAATLIPYPYNIALAVGAEWAYLRGLISGAGVRTPWAARLNVSAVALVILYGSLWGFRSFHLIPDVPPPFVAVLLTLIHIGAIGAVTLCSAMLHRDVTDKASAEATERDARAQARKDVRDAHLQQERDAIALESERKQAELTIWIQGQEAKARLKMQSQNARGKMQKNAHSVSINAEIQSCPKCAATLDRPQWLAARRWGHCSTCKEQP